jgi:hypothetical protein
MVIHDDYGKCRSLTDEELRALPWATISRLRGVAECDAVHDTEFASRLRAAAATQKTDEIEIWKLMNDDELLGKSLGDWYRVMHDHKDEYHPDYGNKRVLEVWDRIEAAAGRRFETL